MIEFAGERKSMKKVVVAIFGGIVLLAGGAVAQTAQRTIYAEGAHKGSTRVVEDKFQVNLTLDDVSYRQRIRDSAGAEHYELTLRPKILEGDNEVTEWQASLRDLRHSFYGNVLQFEQEESDQPRDNLYRLNPSQFAPVPPRARRVFKIEGFYVVLQVKDFHFTPLDSPYLDSMTVQVELSNSDPRGAK